MGILGVIIAAPMLATFVLLGRYVMRKMLDQNPWPPKDVDQKSTSSLKILASVRSLFNRLPLKRQNPQPETESANHAEQDE